MHVPRSAVTLAEKHEIAKDACSLRHESAALFHLLLSLGSIDIYVCLEYLSPFRQRPMASRAAQVG